MITRQEVSKAVSWDMRFGRKSRWTCGQQTNLVCHYNTNNLDAVAMLGEHAVRKQIGSNDATDLLTDCIVERDLQPLVSWDFLLTHVRHVDLAWMGYLLIEINRHKQMKW